MKSIVLPAIVLAAIALFAACSGRTTVDETTKMEDTRSVEPVKTAAVVSLKDDQLNAVYPHYQHLTKALVDGDVAEAKISAQAISVGLQHLADGKKMLALTAKITASDDLEKQRAAFAELSDDFIKQVTRSGLRTGELYVAHCPMARNDNGAAWLTEQKQIRNPYFGAAMMNCGSVKETIK